MKFIITADKIEIIMGGCDKPEERRLVSATIGYLEALLDNFATKTDEEEDY
jgi:hypothetical protein